MPKKQENFIRMAQTVADVLVRFEAYWVPTTVFGRECQFFQEQMAMYTESRTQAQVKTKGATEDKDVLRDRALTITVDLAKRASVFALHQDDLELFEQLNVNKSPLSLYAGSLMLAKMLHIYDLLVAAGPQLEAYHVTADNLAEMQRSLKAFEANLVKPRGIIVTRKRHNHTSAQIIDMLKKTLFKMDQLINIFSGSAFMLEYKNARTVEDLGVRHNPEVPPVV